MFVLQSEITIGKFRFSGVTEVRIKRDIHSIIEHAVMIMPSIARIEKHGQALPEKIVTGSQFAEGHEVVIKLGYGASLDDTKDNIKTEFRGFVKTRDLDVPLSVTCEGNSWLLRRNCITNFWKTISVKEYLEVAVNGLPDGRKFEVLCDTEAMLSNIEVNNKSGLEMINDLYKYSDGTLSCSFTSSGNLWCGFAYSGFMVGQELPDRQNEKTPKYKLGYNALAGNDLRLRTAKEDAVVVKYNRRLPTGALIEGVSDVYNNANRNCGRVMSHIADESTLRAMANEKALRLSYTGYEGCFTGFLQPYIRAGASIYIADSRSPERAGNYLVESTEILFGSRGARRILEVGPMSR